eukprot:TRINITY_DN65673_c0_g1_i1.p1 TRINITY_DN65673_c0_g1~~TRINITY_DN65673_c0_g1_i1.p1  ORF type:complete len:135 (-),score=8.34 TRINITY_DN65673_c0_g1_i1:789-1193(-)
MAKGLSTDNGFSVSVPPTTSYAAQNPDTAQTSTFESDEEPSPSRSPFRSGLFPVYMRRRPSNGNKTQQQRSPQESCRAGKGTINGEWHGVHPLGTVPHESKQWTLATDQRTVTHTPTKRAMRGITSCPRHHSRL